MKKKFVIYYKSGSDPLDAVRHYHSRARLAARDLKKAVCLADVDVVWNDSEAERFWSRQRTIECVSVRNDSVIERRPNPTDAALKQMIENL